MWNPAQYERFSEERSLPFFDLLAMVKRRPPPARVIDLGCGTGELTRHLHFALGAKATLGIDSSAEMLSRTKAHEAPGLSFTQMAVEEYAPRAGERFDLVFSNAALHWVPEHEELFARLTRWVSDEGQLAVQMPANFGHASHVVANEVAAEAPFAGALAGFVREPPVLAPEDYATLLATLGYREQRVRLEVYLHRLPEPRSVIEWVKGTLLTSYRARLTPELYERFVARYTEALLARLPDERPFLYPFARILMWGAR